MDCKHVTRLIDSYAAGELFGDRAGEVREHIDSCADCSKALEEYRLVALMLRSSAPAAPEADERFFRALGGRLDAVDGRVRRRSQPIIRWPFVGALGVAAAAVLLVSLHVVSFGPAAPDRLIIQVRPAERPAQTYASPGASSISYPRQPQSYYVPVSTQPGGSTAQADPYRMLSPLPRIYFPQRSLPIGGTNPLAAQSSITKVDFERLQDKVRQLESRVDTLEQKGTPAVQTP